jgi:hypothetical protein
LSIPAPSRYRRIVGAAAAVTVVTLCTTGAPAAAAQPDGGALTRWRTPSIEAAPRSQATPPPWADAQRRFRTPVTFDAQDTARRDHMVEVFLSFTTRFAEAGAPGATFDPATLRVVEIDGGGAVVDGAVPFQFDRIGGYNATRNAAGTLVILAAGTTPAGGQRRFHVYFDRTGTGLAAPVFPRRVTLTDNVLRAGIRTYRIATPTGTWFYGKTGGAFSSLVDTAGRDWIQWSRAAGADGEFRGVPNAVYPGGIFHPAFANVSSSILHRGPLKVTFRSRTADGAWEARWEVFPDHARMTMLRAARPYWWLYEGLPGGEIDTNDVVIRSSGATTPLGEPWKFDLAGDEWVAFADTADGRSLFAVMHEGDAAIDSHRVMRGTATPGMTVFGFGRDQLTPGLVGMRRFSIGIVDAVDHAGVEPLVQATFRPHTTFHGPGETRP